MAYEVLVAEDNAADLALLKEAIQLEPIECVLHVVRDGEKALTFINERNANVELPGLDLVLLDFYLPKLEGTEVLSHLRSTARFQRTPVILMTSQHPNVLPPAVANQSCVFYFGKPSSLDEFLEIGPFVRRVLSGGGDCSETRLDTPESRNLPA
ncbi:MAG TPA: response regulator [Bryobacteraceae bacterium]|jgi:CheY-like chemotaxis protein